MGESKSGLDGIRRFHSTRICIETAQDAADGVRRKAEIGGDLPAGEALAADAFDLCRHLLRHRPVEAVRPRRAALQPGHALETIVRDPFAGRRQADACGIGGGVGRILRRLPAQHDPNQMLSTKRASNGHCAVP